MKEIRFFVKSVPSPGGSKSAFCLKKDGVYTGRAVVIDAGGKKTKEWRQAVAAAAKRAVSEYHCSTLTRVGTFPLSGAIEVELIFQMPRPKSHFKLGHSWLRSSAPLQHVTRPDLTKLARSTEDACTGILWADDGQIVKQSHEKAYSDVGGCWIIIREAGK